MTKEERILTDEETWKAGFGEDIGEYLAYEAEEQGSPPIIQYYCSATGREIAKAQDAKTTRLVRQEIGEWLWGDCPHSHKREKPPTSRMECTACIYGLMTRLKEGKGVTE